MEKRTIGLIISALVAILILATVLMAGCNTKTEETTEIVEHTEIVELTDVDPVVPEEPKVEESAPITHVVEVSISEEDRTVQNFFVIGEATIDNEPLEAKYEIYCSGNSLGSKSTKADGSFDFSINVNECAQGSEAWIVIEGKESSKIVVGYEADSGSGASSPENYIPRTPSVPQDPTGVPEFSILTLAVAVVIGGLGVAYLRKN
jgi:hypothetical protein